MINITKEQLKELDGIYQMSHKCEDNETKKLAKAIFNTMNFVRDLEDFSIDIGYFYHPLRDSAGRGIVIPTFYMYQQKCLKNLPIIVILYLITKDDKYLKPSRYIKGTIKHKEKNREYIKFSNTCYLIDKIYGCFDSSKFFKVEQ